MKAVSHPQSAIRSGARTICALVLFLAFSSTAAAQSASSAAGGAAGGPAFREVVDETGRRVRVPVAVRRIVSLARNLTQTVYAQGAQDRLVGVTDYCDYPPDALSKPKVGGPLNPSLEQVVALRPDLVLVARTANRRETLEALERLGIATYATNPQSVEGVLDSTLHVADLIGERERGEELVASLRARLANLKQRLAGRPPRRVLFVVWHEPLISVGRNTFLADALRWAGAELAIETDAEWPRLNLEEIVHVQPEFLVFASSHSEGVKQTVDDLRGRPGWRSLEAVRQGRIAVISDAVNRPAPRLVDAIEQLARQLHPAAFQQQRENGKGKMEKGTSATSQGHFPFPNFRFPFRGARCSR